MQYFEPQAYTAVADHQGGHRCNFFKNNFGPALNSLLNPVGYFAVGSGPRNGRHHHSFGLLCLLGVVLAWIDIRHGIIPDWLNLTIAGLGLSKAVIIGGLPAGLEAACEGAAIGAIFWLLRRLYFAFREVQGLGLGDVKFLAAAGIWSRRRGPSHASVGCHADRAGLCRHHAIGGTVIDQSDIDVIRTVSRDRPLVRVRFPTTLVLLPGDQLTDLPISSRPGRPRLASYGVPWLSGDGRGGGGSLHW